MTRGQKLLKELGLAAGLKAAVRGNIRRVLVPNNRLVKSFHRCAASASTMLP